jgi:predicted GIY-YIG superfamily endonuclease
MLPSSGGQNPTTVHQRHEGSCLYRMQLLNLKSAQKTLKMKHHNYFIYITTNPGKSVLYTGITNDLARIMLEHFENRGKPETFAGKFYCYKLIYWERFSDVNDAIAR